MWPVIAANVLGGIANWWGNKRKADSYKKAGMQAGQTALGAFNYLTGSPIGQSYLPAGGGATDMQAALLGLGGDPAAAEAAYDNFLNSTGYQSQLKSGQQAITSSAAARGLLGSGSTGKALTRFGQDLGRQSFTNYLGQLSGLATRGLQAGGLINTAAMQGYSDAANYEYAGKTGAAATRHQGWQGLTGGLGSLFNLFGPQTQTQPQ